MKEKQLRNQRGITLIALLVTIIVLIILATVAINLSLGDNGLFNKAKQAREDYKQAEINEQVAINETAKYMDSIESSKNNGENVEKSEIERYRDAGTYMTTLTDVKDSDGNIIKVPEGFKIAADSGKNVTEGVVIEDKDIITGIGNDRGNQYVWVPVGKKIKKSDGTIVDITLGRYTFADGVSDKGADGTILAKGAPILQQSAENYTDEVLINNYFKELATSRNGVISSGTDGQNTTALNLKGFIDSVNSKGGYYIARYEASYGTDGKANSKISNTFIDANGTTPTNEGTLWNNINQIDAATVSRNLYTTVITDLINSYAWDTAIIYIQEFSGNMYYSYQEGENTNDSVTNTGMNGDEECKINDMSTNNCEWTTENSNYTNNSENYPCTSRGGYNGDSGYTSIRDYRYATSRYKGRTFRMILYM